MGEPGGALDTPSPSEALKNQASTEEGPELLSQYVEFYSKAPLLLLRDMYAKHRGYEEYKRLREPHKIAIQIATMVALHQGGVPWKGLETFTERDAQRVNLDLFDAKRIVGRLNIPLHTPGRAIVYERANAFVNKLLEDPSVSFIWLYHQIFSDNAPAAGNAKALTGRDQRNDKTRTVSPHKNREWASRFAQQNASVAQATIDLLLLGYEQYTGESLYDIVTVTHSLDRRLDREKVDALHSYLTTPANRPRFDRYKKFLQTHPMRWLAPAFKTLRQQPDATQSFQSTFKSLSTEEQRKVVFSLFVYFQAKAQLVGGPHTLSQVRKGLPVEGLTSQDTQWVIAQVNSIFPVKASNIWRSAGKIAKEVKDLSELNEPKIPASTLVVSDVQLPVTIATVDQPDLPEPKMPFVDDSTWARLTTPAARRFYLEQQFLWVRRQNYNPNGLPFTLNLMLQRISETIPNGFREIFSELDSAEDGARSGPLCLVFDSNPDTGPIDKP